MVSQKGTIYKSKRQPTKWGEKYLTMIITNKRLISKIHKKIIQFNITKKKKTVKWAGDLNGHFSKNDILMANRHKKRC